jgi:hypothetical protein
MGSGGNAAASGRRCRRRGGGPTAMRRRRRGSSRPELGTPRPARKQRERTIRRKLNAGSATARVDPDAMGAAISARIVMTSGHRVGKAIRPQWPPVAACG